MNNKTFTNKSDIAEQFKKYFIRRGTWGEPEHRNTAKKKNQRTPHHRKKNRRNTVTATIIFSYIILTSTLYVILLYLNNFPQNKHTIAELALISASLSYCSLKSRNPIPHNVAIWFRPVDEGKWLYQRNF